MTQKRNALFGPTLVLSGRSWFTVSGFLLSNAHVPERVRDLLAEEFRWRFVPPNMRSYSMTNIQNFPRQHGHSPQAMLCTHLGAVGSVETSLLLALMAASPFLPRGEKNFCCSPILIYTKTRQRLAGRCYFSLFFIISSATFGLALP